MKIDECRHPHTIIQQYTDDNQIRRYQQICFGCRKILKQTNSMKDLRIETLRKLKIEKKED